MLFECQNDKLAHFFMAASGMNNIVTHKESTMHEYEAETGVDGAKGV